MNNHKSIDPEYIYNYLRYGGGDRSEYDDTSLSQEIAWKKSLYNFITSLLFCNFQKGRKLTLIIQDLRPTLDRIIESELTDVIIGYIFSKEISHFMIRHKI
jgi:hypothetical protein